MNVLLLGIFGGLRFATESLTPQKLIDIDTSPPALNVLRFRNALSDEGAFDPLSRSKFTHAGSVVHLACNSLGDGFGVGVRECQDLLSGGTSGGTWGCRVVLFHYAHDSRFHGKGITTRLHISWKLRDKSAVRDRTVNRDKKRHVWEANETIISRKHSKQLLMNRTKRSKPTAEISTNRSPSHNSSACFMTYIALY